MRKRGWPRPTGRRSARISMPAATRSSSAASTRRSAGRWPPCTTPTNAFAARSSWSGTASVAASTSISAIRCRRWSPSCAPRSTRRSRRSPTAGTPRSASTCAIRPGMRRSSRAAMRRDKPGRRRCCCATAPATTTACTRTSTASMCFRCRRRSCSRSRSGTSPAASSCSPSSGRACSRGRKSCRLRQGDAVVFAVQHRPVQGSRGVVPRQHAARRQPRASRPSPDARHHLPRCGVRKVAMSGDLFELDAEVESRRQPLAPGAVLLRGFAGAASARALGRSATA